MPPAQFITAPGCEGEDASEPDAGEPDAGPETPDAGEPDAGGSEPQVLSTVPAPEETDVDVLAPLSATFSEAMRPEDLTPATFQVTEGAAPAEGTVQLAGDVAAFTPARRGALLGHYTASLAAGLRAASGGVLAREHRWSFTLRDGRWDGGQRLAQGPGRVSSPQVLVLEESRALASWGWRVDTQHSPWLSLYAPGPGWSAPQAVDAALEGEAFSLQLAAGPGGSAMAVWVQLDAWGAVLFSRYAPGQGWTGASPIDPLTAGDIVEVRLAGDGRGHHVAVWTQFNADTLGDEIWGARYAPDTGWTRATRLETEQFGYTFNPRVAVSASGRAWAAWERFDFDANRGTVWARPYEPGSGWGDAVRLHAEDADGQMPELAMHPDGSALAFWLQAETGRNTLTARRHVPGEGWDTAQPVDSEAPGAGHSIFPHAAFDAAGNALLVWSQYDGKHNSVLANRYLRGLGWGGAQPLETHDEGAARVPRVAVDARGHAVAVWEQHDGTGPRIAARRYRAGQGWGEPTFLDTLCPGKGEQPQVSVGADGQAVALWRSSINNEQGICASRFD